MFRHTGNKPLLATRLLAAWVSSKTSHDAAYPAYASATTTGTEAPSNLEWLTDRADSLG